MATSYYGRHIISGDTDLGILNAGEQRACVYKGISSNGWVTALGTYGGRYDAGSPTIRVAMWDVVGGNPDHRLGYTQSATPGNQIVSGDGSGGGQALEYSLAVVNPTYSPGTAIKVSVNKTYAIGVLATGNRFGHGMIQLATLNDPSANVTFYIKSGLSQPPTDPFTSYTSTLGEGWMDCWALFTINTAPSVLTSSGALPANGGSVTTVTPIFNATYADAERSLGDYMASYHMRLRLHGTTGPYLWDTTYTANSTEQNANQIQRAYGGSALSQGATYDWNVTFTDQHGATSAYANTWLTFTVNAGGVVTGTGTPTGKQTALTGLVFQADWTHAGGLSMTNARLRISQNGAAVMTSGSIAKAVVSSGAPGTLFSINMTTEAGFAALGWGNAYTYAIQGLDSSGLWSSYSAERAFTTDAAPGNILQSGMGPASGTPTPVAPLLFHQLADADDTPAALGGSLTDAIRVKTAQPVVNPSMLGNIASYAARSASTGVTATYSYDAGQNPDGVTSSGALKIAITPNTGTTNVNALMEQTGGTFVPCVVGESYTAHGWVRTDTAGLHPLLAIHWYTSGQAYLSTSVETDWTPTINTNAFRNFTATAPATAAFYRIGGEVFIPAAGTTGNAWFDGFSFDSGVRFTRVGAWNATTSRWEYQTVAGVNQVDTLTYAGTVSGSTFTYTLNGATTAAQPYNVTAANLQIAIEGLSTAQGTGVTCAVTGGPGPTNMVITWSQKYGGTALTTSLSSSVTGGGTLTNVHTTAATVSDIGPTATYFWDAIGSDGTQSGARSPEINFVYAAGPAPVITSPAGTITTGGPSVAWTISPAGTKYQYKIYADAANAAVATPGWTTGLIYDSTLITSAATSFTLPAGYLHNNLTYYGWVEVTNAAGLVGRSPVQSFTLTYTPANALTMQATPVLALFDLVESAINVSWSFTDVVPSLFAQYTLTRRVSGADVSTETVLAIIPFSGQTSFTDYLPTSDVTFTYSVRQTVYPSAGNSDLIDSPRSEADAVVSLGGVVICDALQGGDWRVCLRYDKQRENDPQMNVAPLKTWGNAAPTALLDTTDYDSFFGKFSVANDLMIGGFVASDYMNAVRTMRGNHRVLCWRDERGRKSFILMKRAHEYDTRVQSFDVDIEGIEVAFTEGVKPS